MHMLQASAIISKSVALAANLKWKGDQSIFKYYINSAPWKQLHSRCGRLLMTNAFILTNECIHFITVYFTGEPVVKSFESHH